MQWNNIGHYMKFDKFVIKKSYPLTFFNKMDANLDFMLEKRVFLLCLVNEITKLKSNDKLIFRNKSIHTFVILNVVSTFCRSLSKLTPTKIACLGTLFSVVCYSVIFA